MTNFFQGSAARVTATFENGAHVVTDPATITAKIKNPAGVTTTYVYGTDAALARDSVGIYHVDIDLNSSGIWYYRFEGTGSVKAASQGELVCIAANPA